MLATAAVAITACGSMAGSANETKLPRVVQGAHQPRAVDFPRLRGRSLKQLAASVPEGPQAALAASVFVPGTQRLAFGLIDRANKFAYAESAVYLASSLEGKARGPYPAPLDSIVPAPAYMSHSTAADPNAIKAIYGVNLTFRRPGPVDALILSRRGGHVTRSLLGLKVLRSSPIPNVGDRPPRIDTPTRDSVGGNLKSIDTRIPPDSMHDVSFKDVLGKKPVALLFATPALCQSRVCGPVVDIAEQLKARYGNRMAFIHQEVYRDNTVSKGLRPQMQAFHLQTEPWLFTFDRSGRVAARLEGSFGLHAMNQAVQAALR